MTTRGRAGLIPKLGARFLTAGPSPITPVWRRKTVALPIPSASGCWSKAGPNPEVGQSAQLWSATLAGGQAEITQPEALDAQRAYSLAGWRQGYLPRVKNGILQKPSAWWVYATLRA